VRRHDAIVDTNDNLVKIGDEWFRDVDVTLDPEWVEQMRTGYRCVICFQGFTAAWPDECTADWCRFPVKRFQGEEFARRYQGVDTEEFKPTPPEPVVRARKAGIWVPRSVS
jgi:hypothetical protein